MLRPYEFGKAALASATGEGNIPHRIGKWSLQGSEAEPEAAYLQTRRVDSIFPPKAGVGRKFEYRNTASTTTRKKEAAMQPYEFAQKLALDTSVGGTPSRWAANTVGHVLSTIGLNPLVGGTSTYKSPLRNAGQHTDVAEEMEQAYPQELSNTGVRLGGTRTFNDLKRVFTNPRNSLPGKAWGALTTPLNNLATALTRTPSYNPYADTATQYWDNPAMTAQLLGEAAQYNKQPVAKSFGKRQLRGLKRDAYAVLDALPAVGTIPEWRGSQNASKGRGAGKSPDAQRAIRQEQEALYAPQAAKDIAGSIPYAGYPAAVGSMLAVNSTTKHQHKFENDAAAREKAKKNPRDGDGDGKVGDGTPKEKNTSKEATMRPYDFGKRAASLGLPAAGAPAATAPTQPRQRGNPLGQSVFPTPAASVMPAPVKPAPTMPGPSAIKVSAFEFGKKLGEPKPVRTQRRTQSTHRGADMRKGLAAAC